MDRFKGDLDEARFSVGESEDYCDRGSLFALPCESVCSLLETENESRINENDDDMLLERITRGPVQEGPRRSSVFP